MERKFSTLGWELPNYLNGAVAKWQVSKSDKVLY
jgi:hypothetical protein